MSTKCEKCIRKDYDKKYTMPCMLCADNPEIDMTKSSFIEAPEANCNICRNSNQYGKPTGDYACITCIINTTNTKKHNNFKIYIGCETCANYIKRPTGRKSQVPEACQTCTKYEYATPSNWMQRTEIYDEP